MILMNEVFYPLTDYPDTFISKSGKVVSRHGKMLKASPCSSTGYRRVKIRGKRKNIHRLLAEMFVPNPNNLPMVNHKDGNKLNNSLDNLEWCTVYHNNEHAQKTGLLVKGTQVHTNVLDELQVVTIIKCLKERIRNKDLAKYFRVHDSTIGLIKLGINWKHIPRI